MSTPITNRRVGAVRSVNRRMLGLTARGSKALPGHLRVTISHHAKRSGDVRKTGYSLSGAFLAALVIFVSTMDSYNYLKYGQVWIKPRGFESSVDHPLAVWTTFILDGTFLTITIFVILAAIRRRAKRPW